MSFAPTAIPQPLPLQLHRLTEQFDLTKCPQTDRYGNFAIQNLKPVIENDIKQLEGEIFEPDTMHSNLMLGGRGKQFIDSIIGMKIRMQVDETTQLRIFQAQQLYVHQALITSTEPLTLVVDHSTLLIPLTEHERDQYHTHTWVVEQFCGGFGGWQHGLSFLTSLGFPKLRTLALDVSLENVVQYGLTHEFQMVVDTQGLTNNFCMTFHLTLSFEPTSWTTNGRKPSNGSTRSIGPSVHRVFPGQEQAVEQVLKHQMAWPSHIRLLSAKSTDHDMWGLNKWKESPTMTSSLFFWLWSNGQDTDFYQLKCMKLRRLSRFAAEDGWGC